MTSPLKEDVRRYFPYLFEEFGFEFVDTKDDFAGNIAIVESRNMRIRFIRDRADFFLDVASVTACEDWMGFYSILDRLKAKRGVSIEYKYDNKIKTVAKLLGKCFPAVQDYLQVTSAEDRS